MKQMNIFDPKQSKSASAKKHEHHHQHPWRLFVDGASRNNPGPSGAGIYLVREGEQVLKKGFYLGKKTNNQAEYLALLLGIFYVKKSLKKDETLVITSDSQLLIRQLQGTYKIKNPELKILHGVALKMLEELKYECCHVLRVDNQEADEMANEGIDKKVPVPAGFITVLQQHDVQITF